MFITGVDFFGFKRFIHNNIQELSVDFTSVFQIILGTNGCGKSSLMHELTPFPPHKSLFTKDGYRRFKCTHRGSSYEIYNDYSTDKHSISKDGVVLFENLNPSMMIGVIKQIFNLDRTIADIITDKKKFTDMGTNERRELIMRASGINIDIGLNILNELKEQKSYYKEYTKNLSKRLVTEENNIPSDTHIENLTNRKADILHDLSVLDELATQPVDTLSEWEMGEKIKEVEQAGKQIAYAFVDTPVELHNCRDEVDAKEVLIQQKFRLKQINDNKQEHAELIENLRMSLGKSTFSATEDELRKLKTSLEKDIQDLRDQSNGFLVEGDDIQFVLITVQEVYERLRDLFTRLPDNSSRYFNKEKRDANVERILKLNNKIGMFNRAILGLEHEANLHRQGDLIECPSCTFEFIPGVRLSKSEITESLASNNKMLAEAERELAKEKEYETEMRDYQMLVLEIENAFRYYTNHQKLVNALKDYGYINNPPAHCLSIIEQWFIDVNKSSQLNHLKKRLAKTEQELTVIVMEDWEKKKADEIELSNLTHHYSTILDAIKKKELTIQRIQDYIQHTTLLREWLGKSNSTLEVLSAYHKDVLNNIISRFVFTTKVDLNNELAEIEKEITNITYLKYNRDKLLADKLAADEAVENISILQEELSPKTGLLGEVMDEFIYKFVTSMNNIIKSVWTYPMEILPCRNKKGDLDFYFPVQVMNETRSDDVANLSSSQRDMINYAFKRLIIVTNDLEDFPSFNDEFSNTMDDTHRVRAMKMIYDSVTNNQCSQMFFISHFAPQHGVFTQAETLVINADNLQTIPENYNAHAKII